MALEYTRRYWWLVLIIVPIVVAIIQLVPDFDKDEGKSDDGLIFVQVSGPQFNGDVAFNTVNVAMETSGTDAARNTEGCGRKAAAGNGSSPITEL